MTELIFLKLGGSLITDKTHPYTARLDKLAELANEIRTAMQKRPDLRIVLGHGSGSFGHYAVKEHLSPPSNPFTEGKGMEAKKTYWNGFAEVWYRASQLNRYVLEALHQVGMEAMAFPPSASIRTEDGNITSWDIAPLQTALEAGLVPVIYGDIVFDARQGGTILSTEALMSYLTHHLKPSRILLAGLEAAVWADFPTRQQRVVRLTPASYKSMSNQPGGSHGTDVTGGMKSKVGQMLALVRQVPEVSVQIFSGEGKGNIEKAMAGEHLGTLITCD